MGAHQIRIPRYAHALGTSDTWPCSQRVDLSKPERFKLQLACEEFQGNNESDSQQMRVAWEEYYYPHHADDYEDWTPQPPTKYAGEVINAIRAFGETRLVVMLDSGEIREVQANRVRRVGAAADSQR